MFGTFAHQHVFTYPTPETYKGVIINANMASYAPAGIASFLHEKTKKAPYIIDPLTHAFQHDPQTIANKDGVTKPSIASLAEAYGGPVYALCGKRHLMPSDLTDKGELADLVKNTLDYQIKHLAKYMRETDAAKYLPPGEIVVPPYAVVAPYFFMSETTVDDWFEINLDCLKLARKHHDRSPKLFGSIVIDQGVLQDEAHLTTLVDGYGECDVDGFLIWVDGFDERAASCTELKAIVHFAKRLRKGDTRETINTHGSFFSIMAGGELGDHAFSGVTHGPEFGEYRGVVPVGGGIPISRYYIPQLHTRIRYRDALGMLQRLGWLDSDKIFHKHVCSCDECVKTLEGDVANFQRFGGSTVKTVKRRNGLVRIDFPTTEARNHCLKHYLQRKRREFDTAEKCNGDLLVKSVSRGYHEFKQVAGLDGVKHLRLWLKAFDKDVLPESDISA